jgi:hypothetical protein
MNDIYRSQFRLPWALYESLQSRASSKGISLNAEIVQQLQNGIDADDKKSVTLESVVLEQQRQAELLLQLTQLLQRHLEK